MEAAGIGVTPVQPSASVKTSENGMAGKKLNSFNKMLTTVLANGSQQKKAGDQMIGLQPESFGLLNFLQTEVVEKLQGGEALLQQVAENPKADLLQLVKNFLGINDQKWSEILSEFGGSTKEKLGDDQDIIAAILAGIAGMTGNQLQLGLNPNTKLFLKVAKLFDMLTAVKNEGAHQQNLEKLLDSVTEKLYVNLPSDQRQTRQQYLEQTLSTLAGEITKSEKQINSEAGANQEENTVHKLTGWNGSHLTAQLLTKPVQIAQMTDQSTRSSVTLNELQQQFETILAKSQFSKTDGLQRLFIKLNPDHLGSLRIELVQKDQAIVAKILTSTNLAKEALESHLEGLKHAFASQNIQVDRVEISQQASLPERYLKDGRQNEQNFAQQGRQNQEHQESGEETADEFTLSLEEALLNMEV